MEIREITTYNPNAPTTGYGIWVIFELKERKVQMIHPNTLTELIIDQYEYLESCGNSLWPFNNAGTSFNVERFTQNFKERIAFFIKGNKSFSIVTASKIIAELDDISEEKAMEYIHSLNTSENNIIEDHSLALKAINKADRSYLVRKGVDLSKIVGRKKAIVDTIQEHGPISIPQINHLITDRLVTKCGINRTVTYLVNKLASQGILEIVT